MRREADIPVVSLLLLLLQGPPAKDDLDVIMQLVRKAQRDDLGRPERPERLL